jgi:hypothetical protein
MHDGFQCVDAHQGIHIDLAIHVIFFCVRGFQLFKFFFDLFVALILGPLFFAYFPFFSMFKFVLQPHIFARDFIGIGYNVAIFPTDKIPTVHIVDIPVFVVVKSVIGNFIFVCPDDAF